MFHSTQSDVRKRLYDTIFKFSTTTIFLTEAVENADEVSKKRRLPSEEWQKSVLATAKLHLVEPSPITVTNFEFEHEPLIYSPLHFSICDVTAA
jgi:hypothetical protein